MFILSSTSGTLELCHTSIQENSELKVLKYIKFCGEIFDNWPNALFGTKVYKTLESIW